MDSYSSLLQEIQLGHINMDELNDKVIIAKTSLTLALKDNVTKYLTNMKLWFRNKYTKEQFDAESRKLLPKGEIHLHNQFLIAILNKIDCVQNISKKNSTSIPSPTLTPTPVPSQTQVPTTTNITTTPTTIPTISTTTNTSTTTTAINSGSKSSSKKRRKVKLSDRLVNFSPSDIYGYLSEEDLDFVQAPTTIEDQYPETIPAQRYCVQELFLPDAGFIMGRFLVGAWENGLINVEDEVAEYVATAVQYLLKNILSSIILKRKNYKSNIEGTFFYDVGKPMKDPFLKNTISRQILDDAPIEIDKEITTVHLSRKNDDIVFLADCEELYPTINTLITIKDVYKALRDRNIIPSHSVYSINMERITQMLH